MKFVQPPVLALSSREPCWPISLLAKELVKEDKLDASRVDGRCECRCCLVGLSDVALKLVLVCVTVKTVSREMPCGQCKFGFELLGRVALLGSADG